MGLSCCFMDICVFCFTYRQAGSLCHRLRQLDAVMVPVSGTASKGRFLQISPVHQSGFCYYESARKTERESNHEAENKSIVVTGASSGMGKAIVELFVKEGANVIAVARRKERLEALAESLKNEAGQVQVYAGDVSRREDCEGMIDAAIAAWGRLDILVNNAGVMDDMAPIAEASDEKFRQVMDVNVYGPMAAMRKAIQVFLEQGQGGNIINVSSVGASHQAAGPIYGASKAALNAMSRNTAFMYKEKKSGSM